MARYQRPFNARVPSPVDKILGISTRLHTPFGEVDYMVLQPSTNDPENSRRLHAALFIAERNFLDSPLTVEDMIFSEVGHNQHKDGRDYGDFRTMIVSNYKKMPNGSIVLQVLSMCTFRIDSGTVCEIQLFATELELRGKGLARTLLTALERTCRRVGVLSIILSASFTGHAPVSWVPSEPFWRHFGYVDVAGYGNYKQAEEPSQEEKQQSVAKTRAVARAALLAPETEEERQDRYARMGVPCPPPDPPPENTPPEEPAPGSGGGKAGGKAGRVLEDGELAEGGPDADPTKIWLMPPEKRCVEHITAQPWRKRLAPVPKVFKKRYKMDEEDDDFVSEPEDLGRDAEPILVKRFVRPPSRDHGVDRPPMTLEDVESLCASKKLQSVWRAKVAKRAFAERLAQLVTKEYDEASGRFFYYNTKTGTATFIEPKVQASMAIFSPFEEQMILRIQLAWRGKMARKIYTEKMKKAWYKQFDPSLGQQVWVCRASGRRELLKPEILGDWEPGHQGSEERALLEASRSRDMAAELLRSERGQSLERVLKQSVRYCAAMRKRMARHAERLQEKLDKEEAELWRLLVEFCDPWADQEKNLLNLEEAMEMLKARTQLSQTQCRGTYPLHYLCAAENVTHDALSTCLRAFKEAAFLYDKRTMMLPLHTICQNSLVDMDMMGEIIENNAAAVSTAEPRGGRMPLHLLAYNQHAHIALVKYLIDAYPPGVRHEAGVMDRLPPAQAIANSKYHGAMPLHCVTQNPGMTPELFELVYNAYPGAAKHVARNGTVLHFECASPQLEINMLLRVLRAAPENVIVHDQALGRTPLQLICRNPKVACSLAWLGGR